MGERGRRFVQSGPISYALEDPAEQVALTSFFVDSILPLEITSKKISEHIVAELEKLKIIGGSESVLSETARNKIALDGIIEFLTKTFDSQWTEREKKG